MPIPEQVLARYVDAEMALRRQLLLRGYELGKGSGRLDPESAVAFLDAQFQPELADALEAIREERHDLKKAGQSAVGAMRTWFDLARERLAAETEQSVQMVETLEQAARREPAAWRTARVGELSRILAGTSKFVLVRKGNRRGIVFAAPLSRSLWQRLVRRASGEKPQTSVHWENGTVSALDLQEYVEWCPLRLPS